jgi:hypothetical protein
MNRHIFITLMLCCCSSLVLSSETNDVYFTGRAKFVIEQEYWNLRKADLGETADLFRPKNTEQEKVTRFYLLLNGDTGIEKEITVWVQKDSGALISWRLNTKISCSKWSIDKSSFSDSVRNGRTLCDITLKVLNRYPNGGSPTEIEFTGLDWIDQKKK